MTRALSERQAGACEGAKTPASQCRCRCKGALHGAARVKSRAEFERLACDDPHHLPATVQRAFDLDGGNWSATPAELLGP